MKTPNTKFGVYLMTGKAKPAVQGPLSAIKHTKIAYGLEFAPEEFITTIRRMRELYGKSDDYPPCVVEFWQDKENNRKQRRIYEGCYFTGSSQINLEITPAEFIATFKISGSTKETSREWFKFDVKDSQIISLIVMIPD